MPEPASAARTGGRSRTGGLVRTLATAGVLVLLVAAYFRYAGSDRSDHPNGYGAAVSCESFVRGRLPAPSTARFERPEEVKVGRRGADRTVESFVVADDSAGARARTRYNCLLRHDAAGGWQLAEVSLYRYRF